MLNAARVKSGSADRMDDLVEILAENIAAAIEADVEYDVGRGRVVATHCACIEHESSWLPCRSAPAALAKLAMMESVVGTELLQLEGDMWDKMNDYLNRQVGSVIRWIEREYAIKREDYRLDYYHPDACERRAWGVKVDGDGEIPW
jgi:hypothetical protein